MTNAISTIATLSNLLEDKTLLIGLVLIGACLILLRATQRKGTRIANPRDYTREVAARIRQQQTVASDMETLIVKLSEAARDLNAQMDTRFAKLEYVIAEADRRTAALEALLRKTNNTPAVDIVVDDAPQANATAAPTPPADKSAKSHKRNRRPRKPDVADSPASTPKAIPAAESIVQPTPIPVTPAAEPAAPVVPVEANPPSDPRYGRIYAMADKGHSAVEIARQTGQTTGEIELILNLRKSRAGQ